MIRYCQYEHDDRDTKWEPPYSSWSRFYIYIYYIPPTLTVHFSMTRSVRYQPILHTLYYTLHTEHAYCLSYRFLNNVVIPAVIEMVEMVEILDGRLGKRSVERVRYVINNLLHLVIVKYGDILLVLCISTRLRLVTILSLLVKYLIILHADPCNKSYVYVHMFLVRMRVLVIEIQALRNERIFSLSDIIFRPIWTYMPNSLHWICPTKSATLFSASDTV